MMTAPAQSTAKSHDVVSREAAPSVESSVGRLLTSAEVADLIRVPHATLRYWRHIGIGPKSFKMGPRRVLYREDDVIAWAVEQYGAAG
jgi:hypothetical protein